MTDGNGHGRKLNFPGLLRRQPRLPHGPFNGADLLRVVEAMGWTADPQEAPDEVLIYRHPEKTHRFPVDPAAENVYEGDPVFNNLYWDLDLSPAELVDRLRRPA